MMPGNGPLPNPAPTNIKGTIPTELAPQRPAVGHGPGSRAVGGGRGLAARNVRALRPVEPPSNGGSATRTGRRPAGRLGRPRLPVGLVARGVADKRAEKKKDKEERHGQHVGRPPPAGAARPRPLV